MIRTAVGMTTQAVCGPQLITSNEIALGHAGGLGWIVIHERQMDGEPSCLERPVCNTCCVFSAYCLTPGAQQSPFCVYSLTIWISMGFLATLTVSVPLDSTGVVLVPNQLGKES